jgi:hypothetical protein
MGMDVYGVNPKIRRKSANVLFNSIPQNDDWFDRWNALSEKDKTEYFEAKQKYEDNNPGIYFRNNVWWWRPLWDYVYSVCPDILGGGRYHGGHGNGGTEFSDKEAKEIAAQLFKEIENGDTDAYAELYRIKTEDDKYEYPFDIENVKAFATFCKDSGGFQIC